MLDYYRQVDVMNETVRIFLLHNKWEEIVRVNLQIAVMLLTRYVRRLSAFEEILDEGAKMSIEIKRHLFLRLYMEDRWPRRLGNGHSQASADVPSKIRFLENEQ